MGIVNSISRNSIVNEDEDSESLVLYLDNASREKLRRIGINPLQENEADRTDQKCDGINCDGINCGDSSLHKLYTSYDTICRYIRSHCTKGAIKAGVFQQQAVLKALAIQPRCLFLLVGTDEYEVYGTAEWPIYHRTPMTFFFWDGADLETIQELCRIYKENKLYRTADWGFSPIHDFCSFAPRNDDILTYLIQQFPEMLLQVSRRTGQIPLDALLMRFVRNDLRPDVYPDSYYNSDAEKLESLHVLISAKPEMITLARDDFHLPLARALEGSFGSAVRKYLFSVLGKVGKMFSLQTNFHYGNYLRSEGPLGHEAGVALSQVLTNIQEFDIAYDIWTFGAFQSFWASAFAVESKRLQTFSCPILLPLAKDPETRSLILHFFKRNTTMEEITFILFEGLSGQPDEDSDDESVDALNEAQINADHHQLIEFCMDCFWANSSVKSAKFKGFNMPSHSNSFDALLKINWADSFVYCEKHPLLVASE